MKWLAIAAAVAVLGLTACEKSVEAPADRGVCFMVALQKDGTAKFNPIAQNVKDIEHCGAELEKVRINFARLGSAKEEYIGAYQTYFVIVRKEGIFTASKLGGQQYLAMVRFHGELVAPGAIVEGKPATAP
ncbi:hypothetical protein BH11PSE2_BH11PSE2_07120 [soil metagenome]